MKNYLIGCLALCLLASASMIYRQGQTNVFLGFDKNLGPAGEPTLYLYGFFSSDSCMPCAELIGVLNQLPEDFRVTGVVPQGDAPRIPLLREQYQVRFPIYGAAKFRRYKPVVNPTIIGVSRGGKLLFVLPCVTLEPEEIRAFLDDLHLKLSPYLADESF